MTGMFIRLLIISVIFIALTFLFLGIRMLLKRGSTFPETHISRNPEMHKRGITCAQRNDVGCTPSSENISCCSCSSRED
jgi:hypothetical protein